MSTPNDDRSHVKDPHQPDLKANQDNQDNRSRQLNPKQQEQEPAMDREGQTGSSPQPGAGAEKDK